MAKVGEVLERFVQRGMKKRMAVLRSPKLFKDGLLDQLRQGIQQRFGEFERSLDALVESCKKLVLFLIPLINN